LGKKYSNALLSASKQYISKADKIYIFIPYIDAVFKKAISCNKILNVVKFYCHPVTNIFEFEICKN